MKFNNIFKSRSDRLKQQLISEQFRDLNYEMQKGYNYLSNQEYNEVVEIWINVWNELMDYMEKNNIRTFKSVDKSLNVNEFVSNWANDFVDCLYCIVSNSRDPEVLEVYGNILIQISEQIQKFADSEDEFIVENAKSSIAQTYFFLGNIKKGEELFENYLSENSKLGWGWIKWSDQYWLCKWENADFAKGEELLLKALEVSGLNDRGCVEDRLHQLYSESGQDEKLKSLEEKLNHCNIEKK